MSKKKILVIVTVAIAAGLVGVAVFVPKKSKITYDTARVKRGSVVQTVQATGAVVSSADIELKFETSGRIKTIRRAVGDAVKAGDVLAELDNRDAALAVQKAQAALLSAQATYDKVAHGATAEEIAVSAAAVESARTNLEVAKQSLSDARQAHEDAKASNEAALARTYSDLKAALESAYQKSTSAIQVLSNDVYDAADNLREGFTSTDSTLAQQSTAAFTEAREAVSRMASDVSSVRAAQDHAEIDQLAAKIAAGVDTVRNAAQLTNAMMQGSIPAGSTSEAELDGWKAEAKLAWTDMVAAANAVVSAQQAVVTVRASATAALNAAQSKINASEQNVKVYEASLASAEANLALKKAPVSSFDIENARANVAQARAALSSAQVAIDRTRIKAPFAGTIAQVTGKVGLTVTPADIIMRLHGADIYEVEADVPETDVAKLSAGMDAVITLDAYGSETEFPAKLVSIDTAETVIQDIVYYKTRFLLSASELAIRAGMTADVTVIALRKEGVLFVPVRAVRTRDDGTKIVRVLENGAVREVEVVVGIRGDENRIEILSGLSEGQEVVLAVRENGKIQ